MDKWVLKAYKYTRKRLPVFPQTSIDNINSEVTNTGNVETRAVKDMTPNASTEGRHVESGTHSDRAVPLKMSTDSNEILSDFDKAYALNEEIPVVGYTSADDSSTMQVLNGNMQKSASPFNGLLLADNSRVDAKLDSLEVNTTLGMDIHFGIHQGNLETDSEMRHLVTDPVECKTVLENSKTMSNNRGDFNAEAVNSSGQLVGAQVNICATSKPSHSQIHQASEYRWIRGSKSLDGYMEQLNMKDSGELRDSSEVTSESCDSDLDTNWDNVNATSYTVNESSRSKRNSMTSDLGMCGRFVVDLDEPIHMTLEEVRSSLHNIKGMLEASSSATLPSTARDSRARWSKSSGVDNHDRAAKLWGKRMHFGLCPKSRQIDPELRLDNQHIRCLPKSLKHTLCHWLGIGKSSWNPSSNTFSKDGFRVQGSGPSDATQAATFINRALPPVPHENQAMEMEEHAEFSHETFAGDHHWDGQESTDSELVNDSKIMPDFAASIQKVKDCGWYWGPISGEIAEKILVNEPDGSFIVRDSSDEHYIFSLTFKLNGFVRHVRIEHDQGNFSFGTYTIFKSHTIVEFIENAVQHSRSGRYLFFLHRRPILGPMRVQLLHPVSRFKKVQSLQHMCRFIILKAVRRDHIDRLPLPLRLKHYLNTPQYYAEQMQDWQTPSNGPTTNTVDRDTEY